MLNASTKGFMLPTRGETPIMALITGYRNSSLRPVYVCIVFQSVPR